MSDNMEFNILRAVQPQKVPIPINKRFNKLTLSGHKKEKMMSRLNSEKETPTPQFLDFLNYVENINHEDNISKDVMEKLRITDSDDDVILTNDPIVNRSPAISNSNSSLDDEPIFMGEISSTNISRKNNCSNDQLSNSAIRKNRLMAIADTESMTIDESDIDDENVNARVENDCSPNLESSIEIIESDTPEDKSSNSINNKYREKRRNRENKVGSGNSNSNSSSIRKEVKYDRNSPQVDISAKINIKIRVPISTSSNTSSSEEDKSDNTLSSLNNDRRESTNSNLSSSNEELQRRQCTPTTNLSKDDDTNSDIFLSKSKSLLNRLYGRSWQTPEVISNLESSVLKSNRICQEKSNLKLTNSSSSTSSLDLNNSEDKSNFRIKRQKAKKNQMKDINQRFNENMKLIEDSSNKDVLISAKNDNKLKGKNKNKDNESTMTTKKYGFLKSLDECVSTMFCDPDALFYRNNYKSEKENLSKRLYDLYNDIVFNGKLNVTIEWNKKLSLTAGRCLNKKRQNVRLSIIELSNKVLTNADRLRCTLIHELCHAATWIFNGESGHGKTWKCWAARAIQKFPELPPIQVCHQYDIEYKYTYKCVLCGAKLQAHSKARKVENIVCRFCHGNIEIFYNKKDKNGCVVPTPIKKPSGFAKFVQDNYSKFKEKNKKMTHAEIMKLLSKEYSALK